MDCRPSYPTRKKIHTERMLKHSAKSIPNRVTREIGNQREMDEFYLWFQRKMSIKHDVTGICRVEVGENQANFRQNVTLEWKSVLDVPYDEYRYSDIMPVAPMGYPPSHVRQMLGYDQVAQTIIDELRR